MEPSLKTLFLDIPKEDFSFIFGQANKRNMTISEYIMMCVLSYNNFLCLNTLINQLRRLRYQIKLAATNNFANRESEENIKSLYDGINTILKLLHSDINNGHFNFIQ